MSTVTNTTMNIDIGASTEMKPLVYVMAGGTGGHVIPALAVARGLAEKGYAIRWLGTTSGIEARLVPEAGFPIDWLEIGGVRGKNMLTRLLTPWRLLRAVYAARARDVNVQFDVVAVLKDTSEIAAGQEHATGVMRAIMRDQVPAARIHLGVRTDPALAASQVRVYVR